MMRTQAEIFLTNFNELVRSFDEGLPIRIVLRKTDEFLPAQTFTKIYKLNLEEYSVPDQSSDGRYDSFFKSFSPLDDHKDCLREEQLVQLAKDDKLRAKSAHLASCPLCQSVVENLRESYREESASLDEFLNAVRIQAREIERQKHPSVPEYLFALFGFRRSASGWLALAAAALVLAVVVMPGNWTAPFKTRPAQTGLRADATTGDQTQKDVKALAEEAGEVPQQDLKVKFDKLSPQIAQVNARMLSDTDRAAFAVNLARLKLHLAETNSSFLTTSDVALAEVILKKDPGLSVVSLNDKSAKVCLGGRPDDEWTAEIAKVSAGRSVHFVECTDNGF